MRIAVTGSSGKVGRAAMAQLREAGHRVTGFDVVASVYGDPTVRLDCAEFGAVMGALSGIDAVGGGFDAVLHLAGIPLPGATPDEETFRINTLSTYNIFSAASRLGIRRVAWASSETLLGLPFADPPAFAPVTEAHPVAPNWSYALSKALGEEMADQFVRWQPELSIVSLRFSNVYGEADYKAVPAIQANPKSRKMNLWSYVDAEDAGEACRLAVETELAGHHRLIIAGPDNIAGADARELMTEHFPGVPLSSELAGDASLLSSALAGETIGYRPRRSWRARLG